MHQDNMAKTETLVEPEAWDAIYDAAATLPSIAFDKPYERIFLEDQIGAYLHHAKSPGTVVELGSAPGRFAVLLAQKTGLTPYGVEVTPNGAQLNRRFFAAHGYPEENVVEASFMDPAFIEKYQQSFDMVGSFGLIEHFKDVPFALKCHFDILRPGGLAIISIPNLRGFNGIWRRLFNPELDATHDLELMQLANFRKQFSDSRMSILYCGMAGRYHVFYHSEPTGWRRYCFLVLTNSEVLIHKFFSLFGRTRKFESRFFSPYLLCILKRTS
jgi:SAM-dependent methyltransferase